MNDYHWVLGGIVLMLVLQIVLLVVAGRRRPGPPELPTEFLVRLQALEQATQANRDAASGIKGLVEASARAQGQELRAMSGIVNRQLETVGMLLGERVRELGGAIGAQLGQLAAANGQAAEQLRAALNERLGAIQADNAARLEEMRRTVDEKLHATLEQRLGESFRIVSERLEQVHRGLGEMQSLAAGVGDLRRVLTNVKARGTWGEMQLGALLEQILTPSQFASNVATRPGSTERVEFAVRLPGQGSAGEPPVWLPIDAKFPIEDYQRLGEAQERADPAAAEEAGRALEARIRAEARTIREKYLEPPHTTDFGILYLPIEGLYAEVLRRPGLAESLQREWRVTLAGPTTLAAMLNSLQMGFRTLAIEQRSSEVWQVLGAVKTEFARFGEALAHTRRKLEQATRSIGDAEVRSRAMARTLRDVEALPASEAVALLGDALAAPDAEQAPGEARA